MLFFKAFGVWLVMLVAAFLNGALRELLIVRLVGAPVGHVISVFVLSGAIFGIAYLFVTVHRLLPASTLFRIGLFWLVLSLLFEFGFFHYAMYELWEKLWADYNAVSWLFPTRADLFFLDNLHIPPNLVVEHVSHSLKAA